jgi:inositol polyphosphate-4-phosphatase
LLKLARQIVRRLWGGRTVCCKSAKDRTSMSVTWEQGSLLNEALVSESDSLKATTLMRLEGVRRANVWMNTGKTEYAFNYLQRQALPEELRPVEMCCGDVVS